jgi:hypothetical protein
VEGGFAVAVGIWICAPVQQQLDQIDPAFCQSRHEGRTQKRRGGVDVGSAFHEQLYRRGMPAPDRKIERGRLPVALIDVGACVERCRNRRDIALYGSVVDGCGVRHNRYKQ